MNETISIRVEHILEKATKTGKPFWILRNNGDGYFVWDSKLMKDIVEGVMATITHDGGEFPKVSEIKDITAPKEGYKPAASRADNTDRRCALITAKDIAMVIYPTSGKSVSEDLPKQVTKIADYFLAYLKDELVEEPAEKKGGEKA